MSQKSEKQKVIIECNVTKGFDIQSVVAQGEELNKKTYPKFKNITEKYNEMENLLDDVAMIISNPNNFTPEYVESLLYAWMCGYNKMKKQ